MRKGNRWLRRVLDQCAWGARKTDTFLGRTFRSFQARIGGKKAAIAVAHKILVIAYHLQTDGTFYDEDQYCLTTDTDLAPAAVAQISAMRWQIELAFWEGKILLGLEDNRCWCEQSVKRVAPNGNTYSYGAHSARFRIHLFPSHSLPPLQGGHPTRVSAVFGGAGGGAEKCKTRHRPQYSFALRSLNM